MEIFICIMVFFIFVLSCITTVFVLAMALLLNKIYALNQESHLTLETIEKDRTSIPDYKQEIPLDTPTYPLRLR
jgi:cell division protein FtsL